ncbi:MAG: hydroxyethylthiazole kinase [Treponemataceae bacterium]|nr:hydroxyethylthiazole kinase [Treponemataceae bacterium]
MLGSCLEKVRAASPLVHNITNYVTVNDVANAILAVGGSPIMSDDGGEVEEITSICAALNINIGTLNQTTVPSMFLAGRKAAALGHPVLLDPVGAGASRLRTETAVRLADEIPFAVIRGNSSEIKTLASGSGGTRGVDADMEDAVTEESLDSAAAFVKEFAARRRCVVAVTGAIDLVADAERCFVIRNGRAEMGRITGTGCQLSGIIAAFLAANPGGYLNACAAAVAAMGLAGEIAWKRMAVGDGNSTYRNRIIDALFTMTGSVLDGGARYEVR